MKGVQEGRGSMTEYRGPRPAILLPNLALSSEEGPGQEKTHILGGWGWALDITGSCPSL